MLDVIVTNLARYLNEPEIIPAIIPDNPDRGVPSDHSGLIAKPNTNTNQSNVITKERSTIRPMPESLLCAVGTKLDNLNLSLLPDMPVAQMVNHFQSILSNLLVETFMEKQITLCSDDLPYFNENLSEAQIHKEN